MGIPSFSGISEQNAKVSLRVIVAVILSLLGFSLLGFSKLFLLAFLPLVIASFFIEQYYVSPVTVLANSFALFLMFLAEIDSFASANAMSVWWVCVISIAIILSLSLIVRAFQDQESEWLTTLKKLTNELGSSRFLYPITFLVFASVMHSITSPSVMALGVVLLLAIYTPEIHSAINRIANKLTQGSTEEQSIGRIVSLDGGSVLKIKLENFQSPGKLVSVFDEDGSRREFLLTNVLTLDSEIIAEAVLMGSQTIVLGNGGAVFRSDENRDENIIGKISVGSDINKIIFEPFPFFSGELEEGDVVAIQSTLSAEEEREVLYQITNVVTQKIEMGPGISRQGLSVYAEQLGSYDEKERCFKTYGWSPTLNQLVRLSAKGAYNPQPIETKESCEYTLGVIPKIKLPIFIDLISAVTHHTALLGVTGSGKSFIAHELVKQISGKMKVVCIDFTGEYKSKLSALNPMEIMDSAANTSIEGLFHEKETEMTQKYPDKAKITTTKETIRGQITTSAKAFLVSKESQVGLFELPGFANTTSILEYTEMFLGELFNLAKEDENSRICIVLEEAHTIIPETNFLGDLGDYGSNKALVSRMAQIALQGRKYGVGLLVVAQRSANVSKTVLTQCNTVICLQSFDNTTKDYMSNYIGGEFIRNISILKQYHAIVYGKAIGSNRPVIIDLTRET